MHTAFLRPMSFGEILDGAFGLYRRHFVVFFTTALVPLVPSVLLTGIFSNPARAAATPGVDGLAISAMLVTTALSLAMWGALTREVGQAWTGGEVSVNDGYRHGLRRFLPLLGAAVLGYLALIAAFMVIGIVAAIGIGIAAAMGAAGGGSGAGVTGAILIMVPLGIATLVGMVVAASALFAVLPAVVIEGQNAPGSISRSIALARGAFGRVAGVVFVATLIVFLPAGAVMFLTGSFDALLNPGQLPTPGRFWLQQMANMVTGALTTPFLISSLVILYYDRRVRTEALDVQLAADALAAG